MFDGRRICLVSASGQNVFFAEIMAAFGAALREQGVPVEEAVDCFPAAAEDLVCMFIPHEFHALTHEHAHPDPIQLRRSIALNTEQPGTSWFELAGEIAAQAGAVLDINRVGAQELSRRGIHAEHAPLGHVPAWDRWGGREQRDRPVDLAFIGRFTERRAQVLARCAPALAGRRAAIHMLETFHPHLEDSPAVVAGERRARLLGNSKVLLNVHQQELAYTEWHRIIGAALNGCVVVSEHSRMFDPLVPGEHFISASYYDLPHVLEGALSDPGRLDAIRQAAYSLIVDEMPMAATVEVVLRAAERAATTPVTSRPAPPAPIPMPKSLPDRKPGWEDDPQMATGDELVVRRTLKHLVLRARALERRAGEASGHDGAAPAPVEQLGPPMRDEPPRLTVLVTVYDYAHVVGEALRSVALSDFDDIEVVVVDDGSTDGSSEAVRAACAELPWLSVRLVRRRANSGLPAIARNDGLAHVRSDLLFVLDADNVVMPQGLRRLVHALDGDPDAAFAYGLIETFDMNGPVGLKSWMDWDPGRLRHGNYIDAMAAIRRSALERIGGYPTEESLIGWEDYGAWIAMAESGLRGIRVPDFVGRYRIGPNSTLSITDIDHSEAWATLLRKHPRLAAATWPSSA